MQFSEVIGQEEVKELLRRQLSEGRIPHAQLFCGPEGCGKLAMALAYASALLCRHLQNCEPCGNCPSCKMIAAWSHPDLHFVFPVIKQKGQSGEPVSDQYLKEWREQLNDTPYFDRQTWLNRIGVENQQSQIGVAESDVILRKLSLVTHDVLRRSFFPQCEVCGIVLFGLAVQRTGGAQQFVDIAA